MIPYLIATCNKSCTWCTCRVPDLYNIDNWDSAEGSFMEFLTRTPNAVSLLSISFHARFVCPLLLDVVVFCKQWRQDWRSWWCQYLISTTMSDYQLHPTSSFFLAFLINFNSIKSSRTVIRWAVHLFLLSITWRQCALGVHGEYLAAVSCTRQDLIILKENLIGLHRPRCGESSPSRQLQSRP